MEKLILITLRSFYLSCRSFLKLSVKQNEIFLTSSQVLKNWKLFRWDLLLCGKTCNGMYVRIPGDISLFFYVDVFLWDLPNIYGPNLSRINRNLNPRSTPPPKRTKLKKFLIKQNLVFHMTKMCNCYSLFFTVNFLKVY